MRDYNNLNMLIWIYFITTVFNSDVTSPSLITALAPFVDNLDTFRACSSEIANAVLEIKQKMEQQSRIVSDRINLRGSFQFLNLHKTFAFNDNQRVGYSYIPGGCQILFPAAHDYRIGIFCYGTNDVSRLQLVVWRGASWGGMGFSISLEDDLIVRMDEDFVHIVGLAKHVKWIRPNFFTISNYGGPRPIIKFD